MRNRLVLFAAFIVLAAGARAEYVFVEAESFQDRGGWQLDTQFIEIMGSPYLLAHGLGEPVKDAVTTVKFPAIGKYRVFVRTKDWVARWAAPGTPGRFQLMIDGKPLGETFGAKGAEWAWQAGGVADITQKDTQVTLRDLSGFDGRCDAILFTTDEAFVPPNDNAPLALWRKQLLGLPPEPANAGPFDLVVVGGGYGGLGAALAAARMGCKVALIQNRGVLGGNGSSEVRVWAQGGIRRGLYPLLGEIVEEFMDKAKSSPGTFEEFGDEKKESIVRAEKNIALFLHNHVYRVEAKDGAVQSVVALNAMTSEETRFAGKLFADCTGHGTIGALAGAELTMQETGHLGMSNMWRWKDAGQPQTFPDVPWALELNMADFPYPNRFHGEWFWESGFDKHPLHDLEYTRDWNLRAVYGAFNAMKNRDGKEKHVNAKLEWIAYVGGTRESRQLLGDVVLTREDIVEKKLFDDGCVPTTWDIDLHYPKEQYKKKFPDDPFISRAEFGAGVDRKHGYPVPYRCLYSRNIRNLFMAGRCVSVNHEALGTVRVMKTGGMMGEVVGKAASICAKYECIPRDVYQKHLSELKELLKLKGVARRDSVRGEIYIPSTAKQLPPPEGAPIDPDKLPGIVLDDSKAKLEGKWTKGEGLKPFIGDHYQYASAKEKASATYEFKLKDSGAYEVRVAYGNHENRATNVPVTITSADGEKTIKVNQQVKSSLEFGFFSLGTFKFESGKPAVVRISNDGVDGNVHIDAVQLLPVKP